MKTTNVILYTLALFLFAFIITMIIIFCIKGSVPDTLITCVFAACTGEVSVLGWIKTVKHKYQVKEEEENE